AMPNSELRQETDRALENTNRNSNKPHWTIRTLRSRESTATINPGVFSGGVEIAATNASTIKTAKAHRNKTLEMYRMPSYRPNTLEKTSLITKKPITALTPSPIQ